MSKKPELRILIGNIGAGKSTLVKKYVQEGYIVLCKDSLRYMIGAGEYIFNERIEKGITYTIENFLSHLLNEGFNIILDETHQTKKERQYSINMATCYGYKIVALQLPIISKEESVKRRLSNNHGDTPKQVWEEVWERKNLEYEEPTIEEGFNEIIRLGK